MHGFALDPREGAWPVSGDDVFYDMYCPLETRMLRTA